MTDIEKAMAFTFKEEGGLANVKGDRGGLTKYGISKRAYPDLDILHLTLEDAVTIFTSDYWLRASCDKLPLRLAVAVFDFSVHSGPTTAVKELQKVLGTTVDGLVGQETLGKVNQWKEDDLINQYLTERIMFLGDLTRKDPSQEKFRKGWIKRVVELRAYLMEVQ